MVSLEDFISETLVQIVRGTHRAQDALGDLANVNPPDLRKKTSLQKPAWHEATPKTHNVEFDVQLTASSATQTSGDAGVKLAVFSAKTDGQSNKETQQFNRIQFSIPLVFQTSSAVHPEIHQ